MRSYTNLFIVILNSMWLLSACNNDSSQNSKDGDDSKTDTNVGGAAEITDQEYDIGKKEDKMIYGNDAANNQTKVGVDETINNNSSDSITNPSDDPRAMQNANTKMSGHGESAHAPANNSAPATADPNNKARMDTVK